MTDHISSPYPYETATSRSIGDAFGANIGNLTPDELERFHAYRIEQKRHRATDAKDRQAAELREAYEYAKGRL